MEALGENRIVLRIAIVQNFIPVNSLIVNFRAQKDFDVPVVTKTKREETHDFNLLKFRDIHHIPKS